MALAAELKEEVAGAEELLASGDWVDGAALVRAIFARTTPQRALRIGMGVHRDSYEGQAAELAATPEGMDYLMRLGREYRAYRAVTSRVQSGAWECQPRKFRLMHVRGEYPFRVRAPQPEPLGPTLEDLSESMGIAVRTLQDWLTRGYAPDLIVNRATHMKHVRPTDEWVWRRLKGLYVGNVGSENSAQKPKQTPTGRVWLSDPREVWQFVCPHCGRHKSEPVKPDASSADAEAVAAATVSPTGE